MRLIKTVFGISMVLLIMLILGITTFLPTIYIKADSADDYCNSTYPGSTHVVSYIYDACGYRVDFEQYCQENYGANYGGVSLCYFIDVRNAPNGMSGDDFCAQTHPGFWFDNAHYACSKTVELDDKNSYCQSLYPDSMHILPNLLNDSTSDTDLDEVEYCGYKINSDSQKPPVTPPDDEEPPTTTPNDEEPIQNNEPTNRDCADSVDTYFHVSNDANYGILGEVPEYHRGSDVIIIVTHYFGDKEKFAIKATGDGKFNLPLSSNPDNLNIDTIEVSYDGMDLGKCAYVIESKEPKHSEFDYEMTVSSPDGVQAGDAAEYDIEVKKISGDTAKPVDIIIDENGISDSDGNRIEDWDFDGKKFIQVTPNPVSNIKLTITTTENTIPGTYNFVIVASGGNIPTDGEFSLLVTAPEQKVSRWITQEEKSRSIEELVPSTYDGSMETFEPSECKINSVPNRNPVYYINGQNNSPAEADTNAQLLADALCRPVKRIYNLTSYSLFFDLIESANLKVGSIDKTPAVVTLYNNIYTDLSAGKSVELYGHSQGALIISNVLEGLQSVHPELFAKNANKITVNTFGGASWFYPDGPKYHHNNFATDMVGLFTGRTPFNPFQVLLQTNPGPLFSDEKMLKIIPEPNFPGHAWVGYMKELPTFIIQHHLRLFNFDKEGLGKDLINYDPSIVLDVFYKLDNSDKEDVAYHYLKNISEPELKQLPNQLRDVLENSLSDGKITSDEKKQLNRIISLRGPN